MSFKKCKIVMLSINQKAKEHNNTIVLEIDNLLSLITCPTKNNDIPQNVINSWCRLTDRWTKPQHLYILSDDEIKEDDWWYNEDLNVVSNQWSSDNNPNLTCKKIIATTDRSLRIQSVGDPVDIEDASWTRGLTNLPQPSQSFIDKYIKEYNKGNQIKEGMVEYEVIKGQIIENKRMFDALDEPFIQSDKDILKISKDNTITIKKLKNSWSREEVEKLLKNLAHDISIHQINEDDSSDIDYWIKENL